MRIGHSIFLAAALAMSTGRHGSAQALGSIELYGLERVADSVIRRTVGLTPGAAVPDSGTRAAIRRRLRMIPGVRDAELTVVCCDQGGGTMLFVGVAESGALAVAFRAAPTGSVALPSEITARDSVFQLRLAEAARAGRTAEADSGGHEFFTDSALNAIQHEYLALAATHVARLRRVLRESASARDRELAAEVLNYVPDVRSVVPDLVAALGDPAAGVRNAAMRALGVIAAHAEEVPALGIRVPPEPFIDLLSSFEWTDRNKAAAALWRLTAWRDRELMAQLRARAAGALIDMARWTDLSHAAPALVLLGRIEGRRDEDIFATVQRGDRREIIEEAERMLPRRRPASIQAPARHLLFRVVGPKGATVYLLGSVHLLSPDASALPPEVDSAFGRAKSVTFETNFDSLQMRAGEMMGRARYAGGATLRSAISPRTAAHLDAVLPAYGLTVDQLNAFKPWFVSLMAAQVVLQRMNARADFGVDLQLNQRAKAAGKPVHGLESTDFQLGLFDSMSPADQEQMLASIVGPDSAARTLTTIRDAWSEGRTEALDHLLNDAMRASASVFSTLIGSRNRAWIPAIENLIRGADDALIVVGAGHLVGVDGVVEILRSKGYKVEQL